MCIYKLQQHLELLHNEFEPLLRQQSNDDLGRMFSLCLRVDGALDDLRKILESFCEREGRAAIQEVSDTAITVSLRLLSFVFIFHI